MTIFVDASVIVAILDGQPEADAFADAIEAHDTRKYCAIGAWEAAQAIVRLRKTSIDDAVRAVDDFVREAGLDMVPIGLDEARLAIGAHRRYGKGRDAAQLNMGDCFAYACARTHDARLLYKGDDFSRTDLA